MEFLGGLPYHNAGLFITVHAGRYNSTDRRKLFGKTRKLRVGGEMKARRPFETLPVLYSKFCYLKTDIYHQPGLDFQLS
jgi:hypothetical protein